ncbi:outer membrane beta-barrel protein [bacterium]|nr:outer membrane beta-barrel protein [bacterium]
MKKNILLLVCISFFIIIPSNVNGQSKYHEYMVGIHSGYSFLLGGGHHESGGLWGECKEETKLGLHGGFSLQCYFSAKCAIQLEMDYQRRTVHEEHTDFVNPEYSYSRVDNSSFTVYYLNLIRRYTNKKNNFSWYFSAGIGVGNLSPHVLYFKIGNGIRYYFSPHTALHLGVSFSPAQLIRLLPAGMMYFSLYVGLEYGF